MCILKRHSEKNDRYSIWICVRRLRGEKTTTSSSYDSDYVIPKCAFLSLDHMKASWTTIIIVVQKRHIGLHQFYDCVYAQNIHSHERVRARLSRDKTKKTGRCDNILRKIARNKKKTMSTSYHHKKGCEKTIQRKRIEIGNERKRKKRRKMKHNKWNGQPMTSSSSYGRATRNIGKWNMIWANLDGFFARCSHISTFIYISHFQACTHVVFEIILLFKKIQIVWANGYKSIYWQTPTKTIYLVFH